MRNPGHPSLWRVRYRERVDGRLVHRAIGLGGEEILAEMARDLILQWRAEADTPEDRRRQELLQSYEDTGRARGYSGRALQRLRAAAERAFGDPAAELRFAYAMQTDDPAIHFGKKTGRPARSGLW